MMSPTATRSGCAEVRQVCGVSFSSLPTTRSTSGIAAKLCGSACAAQPVTTMRVFGCSRRSLRMAWRAWRTASPVTAQVLTTVVSESAAASRRITSDSWMLSRQPKVRTSTLFVVPGRGNAASPEPITPVCPSSPTPGLWIPDSRCAASGMTALFSARRVIPRPLSRTTPDRMCPRLRTPPARSSAHGRRWRATRRRGRRRAA